MDLSETIRAAMRDDGRTLNVLGAAAGIDRGRLSRFLRGQRELTLPAASKLCAALGLELRPVRRRALGKGTETVRPAKK